MTFIFEQTIFVTAVRFVAAKIIQIAFFFYLDPNKINQLLVLKTTLPYCIFFIVAQKVIIQSAISMVYRVNKNFRIINAQASSRFISEIS